MKRQIGKRVEEARVSVRNVRRDALNDLREFKNEGLVSEDEFERGEKNLQELTDYYVNEKINKIGEAKEAEIMEV